MSTHHPSFGRSTGLGSVFKSFTKSLKSSPNVPVQINPTVVGGGQELQKLIPQLQSGSITTRVAAAVKVLGSIEKYAISSIPEVWYLARDLCDGTKVSSPHRIVALKLLVKCIRHGDTSVGTRLTFFKDIVEYCQLSSSKIDSEYIFFLEALEALTENGRDIYDFCIYDDTKNLHMFVESSLLAHLKLVERTEYTAKPKSSEVYQSLIRTLEFVTKCLEFNFTILEDSFVVSIVDKVVAIGLQTLNPVILSPVIEVFTTLAVYGSIPSERLENALFFLTSIYGLELSSELNNAIWQVFDNLRGDETFQPVIFTLSGLLSNPELQKFRSKDSLQMNLNTHRLNSSIGAIEIISKIQILCASQGNKNIDYSSMHICTASRTAASYNVPLLNTAFLRSFDRLFSKDLYEDNFQITYTESFDKIIPFQQWYSASNSIYEVLKYLRPNSDQDKSYIQSICISLQTLYDNHELSTPKDKLVNFFLASHQQLSPDNIDFILNYYTEEKLCSLLCPFWKDNTIKLLNHFYYNTNNTDTKIHTLAVIKDAYSASSSIFSKDSISYEFAFEILKKSIHEDDEMVLDYLFDNLFTYIAVQSSVPVFKQLCGMFVTLFSSTKKDPTKYEDHQATSYSDSQSVSQNYETKRLDLKPTITSDSGMFPSISSFTSFGQTSLELNTKQQQIVSLEFAEKLAKTIVRIFLISSVANSQKAQDSYTLIISMCKFALAKNHVDLLLIICRTLIRIRATKENYVYFTRPQEMVGLSASLKRNTEDSSFKFEKKNSYKWVYPETVSFLPERYFDKPSKSLVISADGKSEFDTAAANSISYSYGLTEIDEDIAVLKGTHTIDISLWFDLVLEMMEKFVDWEVYSFIWAHFCPQLSNSQLFDSCNVQVVKLKHIICEQLTLNLPKAIELPANEITKADLQVVLVRTLSALMAYHDKFSKQDEDQIISSLIVGLGSWEKTAIPCVNILTVCCYELPMSIKKFLSVILAKLQTRVTSAFASTHTLEFLLALIHLPTLTSNFTMDEFKRVFGIAFKYIQYAKDLQQRTSSEIPGSLIQQHGVDAKVEHTPSTTQSTEFTPILSQYILMSSYNVISSWFLKINISDRKSITSFLIKNLISCNEGDGELDDQTVGFIDFIIRFTYSDLPLNIMTPASKTPKDNKTQLDRFLVGNSVFGIETNSNSGDSTIMIRRPTGVVTLNVKLEHDQTNVAGQILPNYYLLQLYNTIDTQSNTKPIPIVEDQTILRALNVLDRIPTVEFHKIGIIYIGTGQSTEEEVLQNRIGSREYENFLNGIGGLAKLKQASHRIYVGGLDTENDYDGEYTRFWRDKTTQIIFHVITMMNNHHSQEQRKKAHIGNNYVNIYFDESGLEYNFNLIRSQFNFLNIRISPHTTTTANYASTNVSKQFFKVQTYRRSGVPGVFATCHFKIISEDKLAVFIRNLAIVANQFATIWHAGGQESIWASRVRHIRSLRDKSVGTHKAIAEEMGQQDAAATTLDQVDPELYQMVEFNSYTS